jgi:hypothetical protein
MVRYTPTKLRVLGWSRRAIEEREVAALMIEHLSGALGVSCWLVLGQTMALIMEPCFEQRVSRCLGRLRLVFHILGGAIGCA